MWDIALRSQRWISFLSLSIPSVLAVGLLTFAVPTRERSFAIYDATISHQVTGDSIHAAVAIFLPFLALLLSVSVAELAVARQRGTGGSHQGASALHFLLQAVLAFLLTLVATCAGKVEVGRLRPYFIWACQPDDAAQYKFQLELGPALRPHPCSQDPGDGRHSFPSGHTSSSAVTCLFTITYVVWSAFARISVPQVKALYRTSSQLRWLEASHTLALFWVTILISFVGVVGSSRIIDYKHHPSDVLAGFLVGAFFGILLALYAIWTQPFVVEKARLLQGLPADDRELLPRWGDSAQSSHQPEVDRQRLVDNPPTASNVAMA